MTMQVLLIEHDDLHRSESLLPHLENQGYDVAVVHTPETAAETAELLWPNLIIFSPANSPFELSNFQEVINKIHLNIPYIIVSHKNRIPIPSAELIFMVSKELKQLNQGIEEATSTQKDRFIRVPNLIIDCHQHQILRNKRRYSLTPKEFKLLYLLITNHGHVLSRRTIMQTVWETDYMGDTRTLDVHVRWLREKVEENPSKPKRLITVRGVGYRFVLHPE